MTRAIGWPLTIGGSLTMGGSLSNSLRLAPALTLAMAEIPTWRWLGSGVAQGVALTGSWIWTGAWLGAIRGRGGPSQTVAPHKPCIT